MYLHTQHICQDLGQFQPLYVVSVAQISLRFFNFTEVGQLREELEKLNIIPETMELNQVAMAETWRNPVVYMFVYTLQSRCIHIYIYIQMDRYVCALVSQSVCFMVCHKLIYPAMIRVNSKSSSLSMQL